MATAAVHQLYESHRPMAANLEDLEAALMRLRHAEADVLELVGAVDAIGLTDIADGLPTTQWLSRKGRMSMPSAKRVVRDARACRDRFDSFDLPDPFEDDDGHDDGLGDVVGGAAAPSPTDADVPEPSTAGAIERLRAGLIGRDHIGVLDRLSNPRIEDEWSRVIAGQLFDAAALSTFAAWQRGATGLAKRLDADGAFDPANDVRNNQLSFRRTPKGVVINATLVGEHGEIVFQALQTESDRQYRLAIHDEETLGVAMPDRGMLNAFALSELCRAGRLAGTGNTGNCEAELIVRLNPQTPFGVTDGVHGADGSGGVQVQSPDGTTLDVSLVARMLCDPAMIGILTDAAGKPLAVGSRRRLATRQQRRMLDERDGGCVMPGCDRPACWADAHHIVEFRNGGCTDLNNLALLCRHHHRVIHRKGWAMLLTDDGWCIFTKPGGTRFWGQRHGKQRAGPLPDIGGRRFSPSGAHA